MINIFTQIAMEKNKVVWFDGHESMVSVILPCSWHNLSGSPTYCTMKEDFAPFANLFLLSDLMTGTLNTC